MGFMDGLGGAASTLVQRDYLAAASLRAAFSREEQSDVAGSNPHQAPHRRPAARGYLEIASACGLAMTHVEQ